MKMDKQYRFVLEYHITAETELEAREEFERLTDNGDPADNVYMDTMSEEEQGIDKIIGLVGSFTRDLEDAVEEYRLAKSNNIAAYLNLSQEQAAPLWDLGRWKRIKKAEDMMHHTSDILRSEEKFLLDVAQSVIRSSRYFIQMGLEIKKIIRDFDRKTSE